MKNCCRQKLKSVCNAWRNAHCGDVSKVAIWAYQIALQNAEGQITLQCADMYLLLYCAAVSHVAVWTNQIVLA